MFARSATVALLALPIFASALSLPRGGIDNSCNTGTLNCCDSVQDAKSGTVTALLGLLGVTVGSVTGQVGLTCNPITVIGLSGNSCSAQPACCSGNTINSLVTLACTPLNVNA